MFICWNCHNKLLQTMLLTQQILGTSLVVQGLRILLPVQRTQIWCLVWGDRTCRGAAEPLCHSCWAHAPPEGRPLRREAPTAPRKWPLLAAPGAGQRAAAGTVQPVQTSKQKELGSQGVGRDEGAVIAGFPWGSPCLADDCFLSGASRSLLWVSAS